MKLVSEFQSTYDANKASALLERNGIASFVSSKRSIRIPMYRGGASAVGLWAVLDEQRRDAQLLLQNPNHKVARRLSRSEIIRIRNSVHDPNMNGLLRFLFGLLGIVALIALAVFSVTRN